MLRRTFHLLVGKRKKRNIENSGPKRKSLEALNGHIFVDSVLGLKGVPAIRAASSVIGTASSAVLAIRSAGNRDVIVNKVLCALLSKTGKWMV